MTISNALKAKNKLASKIKKLIQKISQYNSMIAGETAPYDVADLYAQYESESNALVDLKTRIHKASDPIRSSIFMISELKSQVQFLNMLDVSEGKTPVDRYARMHSAEPVEKVATFGVVARDQKVTELETRIDKIQDELDSFNHNTTI